MAAFTLSKSFRFEASHQLMDHDGKCRNLHGHSWSGELVVRGHHLQSQGPKANMVIDYGELSAICKDIENAFDHKHLNDVLSVPMPTSEFLARWIFQTYKSRLSDGPAWLHAVVVHETCSSKCEYSES